MEKRKGVCMPLRERMPYVMGRGRKVWEELVRKSLRGTDELELKKGFGGGLGFRPCLAGSERADGKCDWAG